MVLLLLVMLCGTWMPCDIDTGMITYAVEFIQIPTQSTQLSPELVHQLRYHMDDLINIIGM